tara:strand:- start:315 stop:668 length:354 start_codon:yes stop_codon:yes gene_type:complete
MACAKRITVRKCNSNDNRDYYANSFVDNSTPNRFLIGKTVKFGYVRGMGYDYPSLEKQKWIIKDVGTCEFTSGKPAPYIQHTPAFTTTPCNSRGTIMARKGRGLSDTRMRRYKRLKG